MGNSSEDYTKRFVRSRKKLALHINSSSSLIQGKYQFKIKRKILHLTFSIFGFILVFKPEYHLYVRYILGVFFFTALLLDTLRISFKKLNHFFYVVFKDFFINRDLKRYSSGTYYLMGCFINILLFPPVIAGIGIIFLGVGDFFASLGGTYLRRYIPNKLPFSHKTYIGYISFIIPTTGIALLSGLGFFSSIISSLITGIFEVYLDILDDNLVLPIVASTLFYIL